MSLPTPEMRIDQYLAALAGGNSSVPTDPQTNIEKYLAKLVELSSNPFKIVKANDSATVAGFSVPKLTVEQVTAIYNKVVAGGGAIVTDKNEYAHFVVNQADVVGDEITIGFLYYNSLLLTYSVENDAVVITYVEVGGE